jgi:trk system potassium uptake protein TrkH
VLGFLGLYVTVLVVSTLLLAAGGFAPMDSLFEATSALGTVGLSTGITSAAMPAWAKLLLIVDMWAGRLEILPVLVFFYPGHWRSK